MKNNTKGRKTPTLRLEAVSENLILPRPSLLTLGQTNESVRPRAPIRERGRRDSAEELAPLAFSADPGATGMAGSIHHA